MIVLYVLVAFVAVGNLAPATIARERDYALAAAARPFLGSAGFKLIAIAAVVSTASAINATLYGAAKFTYLMARHGELPERLGEAGLEPPDRRPARDDARHAADRQHGEHRGHQPDGLGRLPDRLRRRQPRRRPPRRPAVPGGAALALAGAVACVGSLAALIAYAATHIPAQLGVLGGLLAAAAAGEAIVRARRGRGG